MLLNAEAALGPRCAPSLGFTWVFISIADELTPPGGGCLRGLHPTAAGAGPEPSPTVGDLHLADVPAWAG